MKSLIRNSSNAKQVFDSKDKVKSNDLIHLAANHNNLFNDNSRNDHNTSVVANCKIRSAANKVELSNKRILKNENDKRWKMSSISKYLDKRHYQSQERLAKLRYQKYEKETRYSFKPFISNNSKKIIANLIKRENSKINLNHTKSNKKQITLKLKSNEPNCNLNSYNLSNLKMKTLKELEKNSKINFIKTLNLNEQPIHQTVKLYLKKIF